jgi:hypothetical protein
MPLLFLGCFVLLAAYGIASTWLPNPGLTPEQQEWVKHPSGMPPSASWQRFPLLALTVVLDAIILSPVAVAVHRFILLGEIRKGLFFLSPVALRFAGLVALFNIIEQALAQFALTSSMFARSIMQITYWSAILWTLLVFPSIAVEEKSAGPARRLDTAIGRARGNFWLILRAMLLTVSPLAILSVAPYFAAMGGDTATVPQKTLAIMAQLEKWPYQLALSALSIMVVALGAAAASWLYGYAAKIPQPDDTGPGGQ